MSQRIPIKYTIRNIPIEVDRRLRVRARRLHRSLSQTLLDILSRAADGSGATTPYRDLDSFFGSWTADSKVDQALAEQRMIDQKPWRGGLDRTRSAWHRLP